MFQTLLRRSALAPHSSAVWLRDNGFQHPAGNPIQYFVLALGLGMPHVMLLPRPLR
jgi:hypothetical protein